MEDHGFDDVRLTEYPLPGAGRLFGLTLADGTVLQVVRDSDADQTLLAVLPPDTDSAVHTVRLSRTEATALSALLAGIRYVVRSEGSAAADGVVTVRLSSRSPAVGRTVAEIDQPGARAGRVVAVVPRDADTAEGSGTPRRLEAGDRLVLVGRPGEVAGLAQRLEG